MQDLQALMEKTGVSRCNSCGRCSAFCPVTLADPNFSPRLLIERMLLGPVESVYSDPRLWSCLTCGLCREKCPEDVDFPLFIREARNMAALAGYRGIPAHGGLPLAMMRMAGEAGSKPSRTSWLGPDLMTSDESDVLYFVGCLPYYDRMFAVESPGLIGIARNVVRLLNKAGIRPMVLEDERCCGHDLLWTGERQPFLDLAGHNINLIREAGVKKVVTHCPECCFTLKKLYPEFLKFPDVEVLHWTEMLLPSFDSGALKVSALEKIVTYHDPCRLGRFLGVYDPPREILRHIPSLDLREMTRFGKQGPCCGTSSWCGCDAFSKLRQVERLKDGAMTGARDFLTNCPKCLIHFGCAMKDETEGAPLNIQLQDLSEIVWNAVSGKSGDNEERSE